MLRIVPDVNVLAPLKWCGKNSLALMVTHHPLKIVLLVKWLMLHICVPPDNYDSSFYLFSAVALLLLLILEYFLVRAINKYFPFVLGKKQSKISRHET